MGRSRWRGTDPRVRRAITAAGAVEGALKVAALVDLWRRSAGEVRGSRARWAVAITLVNSGGVVPVLYFLRGRRPS